MLSLNIFEKIQILWYLCFPTWVYISFVEKTVWSFVFLLFSIFLISVYRMELRDFISKVKSIEKPIKKPDFDKSIKLVFHRIPFVLVLIMVFLFTLFSMHSIYLYRQDFVAYSIFATYLGGFIYILIAFRQVLWASVRLGYPLGENFLSRLDDK